MIELLKSLKNDIDKLGLFCEIQSETEEILPDIRLTPNSESWTLDNLGNRKSKDINFDVNIYLDISDYTQNLKTSENLIETITKLINSYNICSIDSCDISYNTIIDKAKDNINANYNITLYKRR